MMIVMRGTDGEISIKLAIYCLSCLSIYLSTNLPEHLLSNEMLPVCLSVCLSVCLPFFNLLPSLFFSLYLSIYLST